VDGPFSTASKRQNVVAVAAPQEKEPSDMQPTTLGLDIAKSVFQVHSVDAHGRIVHARRLRRAQVLAFFAELAPCLVGLEACAGAHYWAREIAKLGHDVRLIPPAYVKPYVRRQKNDAADAAAICEAVSRPHMRFVPVKTADNQAMRALHAARRLLVRQRTQTANALRAHLAEQGIVAPAGRAGLARLMEAVEAGGLPAALAAAARALIAQHQALAEEIATLDRAIRAAGATDPLARRLMTTPGVGPLTATAVAAALPDPSLFQSGRELAAWLGLVPRQTGTGGKVRLGPITKQGDGYVRQLLVVGATALLRSPGGLSPAHRAWLERLKASKPARLVTVALANKLARILWALLVKGGVYDRTAAAPA
jgi:transposase